MSEKGFIRREQKIQKSYGTSVPKCLRFQKRNHETNIRRMDRCRQSSGE